MNVVVVRVILAALALSLSVVRPAAEAQETGSVRIGVLGIGSPSPPLRQVFEQALRERGWVAGGNLAIEYRYADGKVGRLPSLADELAPIRK